jgi:nickel/cobalt transporter (NiCoT) family protein
MRGRFVKGIAAIFRSRGRTRIGRIYVAVVAANVASWGWALVAFHDYPVLLGMAMLAYSLGLRHAFDADHIAAIDNVTRKLMQEGSRPVAVGLFFSLGHSTVVVGLSIAIAVTTASLQNQFDLFKNGGGMVAALASALFLFAIAAANIVVLISISRVFRVLRNSGRFLEHDLEHVLASRGFLTRVLGRVFRVINHSWQMYPLGVLFGLGFDTATEIGLLAISARQGADGMSVWLTMVFPALFTAGMILMDTAESLFMVRAYDWALVNPTRTLCYNLTTTAISVVTALAVGSLETLNLIGNQLGLVSGHGFWSAIGNLNDKFPILGLVIVCIFAAAWLISYIAHRVEQYDDLGVHPASSSVYAESSRPTAGPGRAAAR